MSRTDTSRAKEKAVDRAVFTYSQKRMQQHDKVALDAEGRRQLIQTVAATDMSEQLDELTVPVRRVRHR